MITKSRSSQLPILFSKMEPSRRVGTASPVAFRHMKTSPEGLAGHVRRFCYIMMHRRCQDIVTSLSPPNLEGNDRNKTRRRHSTNAAFLPYDHNPDRVNTRPRMHTSFVCPRPRITITPMMFIVSFLPVTYMIHPTTFMVFVSPPETTPTHTSILWCY